MPPKALIIFLFLVFHLLNLRAANDEAGDVSVDSTEGESADTEVLPDALRGLEQRDGAFVLTSTTIDDALAALHTMMIMFYAPWCQHSRRLAPEFHDAAKKLRKRDNPLYSGIVDIAEHSNLSARFNVTSIPWLKVFKNGRHEEYLGERSRHDILKFMERVAEPDWEVPEKPVATFGLLDFKRAVGQKYPTFMLLVVPDCPPCNKLSALFKLVVEELKKKDVGVKFATFDPDMYYDNITILEDYNIPGYPGFVTARLGFIKPYKGPAEFEDLVNYISHLNDPPATVVSSARQLDKYSNVGNIYVVGFFETEDDAKLEYFQRIAAEFRDDFPFGYCLGEECRKEFKVKPNAVAVLIPEKLRSEYDPEITVLDKDYDLIKLRKFVETHQFPLVGVHNAYNEKAYKQKEPLCLVIMDVDWSFDFRAVTTMWHRKVAEIAKDYPKITFVLADETSHQLHLQQLGLDFSSEEINIGIMTTNYTSYSMEPMEDFFDPDKFRQFLDDFSLGKLTPKYYKDPAMETRDLVVSVNGSNFDSVVMDPTKDVLIEFYSPTCGACLSFASTYRKIAVAYRDMRNIVIAKMDAVANDVSDPFSVDYYPTIYLVPTSNIPVLYKGVRTIENIISFMEKYSPEIAMSRSKMKIEL